MVPFPALPLRLRDIPVGFLAGMFFVGGGGPDPISRELGIEPHVAKIIYDEAKKITSHSWAITLIELSSIYQFVVKCLIRLMAETICYVHLYKNVLYYTLPESVCIT